MLQDAEMLARLGYCNPRLLKPIQHRSAERQRGLNLIRARDTLVRARTIAARVSAAGPAELGTATPPLLPQIAGLTVEIRGLDQAIEKLAERYPEIRILGSAPGGGPVIAAAYVLTLDGVDAVEHSRSVGAFLGLRPKQSQSGDSDPEHNISKTGNI